MKPRDSSWLFRVARSCRNRTSEKQKLENHAIYRNESFPDQKFSFSLGIFFVAQTQLVASDMSLATSFFISLQNSSCTRSAAPRFRKKSRSAASALTTTCCRCHLFTRYRRDIVFDRPLQIKAQTTNFDTKTALLLGGLFLCLCPENTQL